MKEAETLARPRDDLREDTRENRFIQEYLADPSANATAAALRAGYSKNRLAATVKRLLVQPRVALKIKEAMDARAARLNVDADWVLENLIAVYKRCMGEVKPVVAWDPVTRKHEPNGEYVFDSKGALGALELIGKKLGLFTPKLEITLNAHVDDRTVQDVLVLAAAGKASGRLLTYEVDSTGQAQPVNSDW